MSGIIDWEAFGAEDEFPETEEGAEGLLDELHGVRSPRISPWTAFWLRRTLSRWISPSSS